MENFPFHSLIFLDHTRSQTSTMAESKKKRKKSLEKLMNSIQFSFVDESVKVHTHTQMAIIIIIITRTKFSFIFHN